ncbi:hypothetical protein BAE44_0020798, partial [Dichanthelium oligosanthes]
LKSWLSCHVLACLLLKYHGQEYDLFFFLPRTTPPDLVHNCSRSNILPRPSDCSQQLRVLIWVMHMQNLHCRQRGV